MIAALPLPVIIGIAWVLGVIAVAAILIGLAALYQRLVLEPRRERHDAAVGAASRAGYEAGEAAAFAHQIPEVEELEPWRFSAIAPRWRRRLVTDHNARAAWAEAFLKGHAACVRAKADVALGFTFTAEDFALLQAVANGERAG
ncbi:MAG TPA: hypothetical protein VEW67_03905 [Thermoleophilaceae bacterium]|nr:hypothetical protein [Thermoleophilaceae bacterium]